jgi:C-terminal processing protease CtpA/Prc
MKKLTSIILFALLLCIANLSFAQRTLMVSKERTINVFDGKNNIASWYIDPNEPLNVFDIYDPPFKTKKIKFVSRTDSLEFDCKLNEKIYFSIVYKGDTAHSCINFTNEIDNTLSRTDKLFALSSFWSEVKYNFVFYDQLNFSWDSLYKAYIPLIENTKNDFEFYNVINRFARILKDGHTGVNYSKWGTYNSIIPIDLRYFNDTMYVCSGTENFIKNIPLGSKILEINGMKAEDYMEKNIYPFVESNIKTTIQMFAPSLLLSSIYEPNDLTLKFRTIEGEILETTLKKVKNDFSKYMGGKRRRSNDPVEIKWNNNIAVLELNSFDDFSGRLVDYFEKIKDTLYSADGIIIDLRNNRGGSTLIAEYYLKHIIKDTSFLTYGYETRINNGVKKATGNFLEENGDYFKMKAYQTEYPETVFIEDSIKRFNCPIVVLTSPITCSAAEDFLIMLYERKDRPLFIGKTSFGSSGSPLVLSEWPEKNGFARICTKREIFPYSLKPFIEGIKPDIIVNETYDDYIADRDKTMEIAIGEIKKSIKTK